jgi:hypothetical protein
MTEPAEVEVIDHEGYVEARYLGRYTFPSYLRRMDVSVQACHDRGGTLLLVDVRSLEGYAPTTVERFKIGEHGAHISVKLARVAVVGMPEQLQERFASLVATNRGLRIQAFTDREEALDWLLGRPR